MSEYNKAEGHLIDWISETATNASGRDCVAKFVFEWREQVVCDSDYRAGFVVIYDAETRKALLQIETAFLQVAGMMDACKDAIFSHLSERCGIVDAPQAGQ